MFQPPEVFLWFISMIVICCTWSLIFGSLDFRKLLRKLPIHLFEEKSTNFFISLGGSLVWNISMTVLTAHILSSDGQGNSAPLRYLLFSWLARPLPGAAIILASLFDYNAFRANFQEIIFVESIYSLPSIWLFGTIASKSIHFPVPTPETLAQDYSSSAGFAMLRGGAAIGLLAWIILIFVLGSLIYVLVGEGISQLWARKDERITWPLLGLCLLRCLAGSLMWVGSVQLSPLNFCPAESMITRITLLWTFVSLVDVLWRGFWGIEEKESREERDD